MAKNNASSARKRPAKQNQVPSATDSVAPEIGDFNFWRALAQQVVPGIKDPWQVGEVACILQQSATRVGEHYRKVSTIADKTETKSIAISIPVKIARMNTPPEVFVGIKYSEKYGDGMTVKVPDPNQTELPLVSVKGGGPTAEEVHAEAMRDEKGGEKE